MKPEQTGQGRYFTTWSTSSVARRPRIRERTHRFREDRRVHSPRGRARMWRHRARSRCSACTPYSWSSRAPAARARSGTGGISPSARRSYRLGADGDARNGCSTLPGPGGARSTPGRRAEVALRERDLAAAVVRTSTAFSRTFPPQAEQWRMRASLGRAWHSTRRPHLQRTWSPGFIPSTSYWSRQLGQAISMWGGPGGRPAPAAPQGSRAGEGHFRNSLLRYVEATASARFPGARAEPSG
jgi:hypothetical protein